MTAISAVVVVYTQTRIYLQEARTHRRNGTVPRPELEREEANLGVICAETHYRSRPPALWKSADTVSSLCVRRNLAGNSWTAKLKSQTLLSARSAMAMCATYAMQLDSML